MNDTQNNDNPEHLRVIKTARSQEAINEAVKQGFWPLVKLVVPSADIKAKYAVYQNKETGEINVVHDYRLQPSEPYEKIIDFTYYYPYHFESPFAAYLIPKDLAVDEKVFIEDLIEDIVGSSWNQGDTYRLSSSKAIWNGNEFDIQYKTHSSTMFIG